MNDAMLSANTFSVKEEKCQEDSFVEDKVYISETAVTADSVVFQGSVWYDKIKQYEEFTGLDSIKTEPKDNIKIRGGISPDEIKIEFDNGLLYCEPCEAYYEDYCFECGMLASILNKNTLNSADCGAREDIPNDILEIQDCFGQTGIFALRIIPAGVKFGPFTGVSAAECVWEMKGEKFVLDKNKSKNMNWMQYVNPTRNPYEINLHVLQYDDNVYYQSTHQIQPSDELVVYFGEGYGDSPNKNARVKDVFACTFCCLGFNSKLHLVKHKSVCVENAAGKFSNEDLMQCPFCKIHLDPKEYFEHHMSFCCERNARKNILPSAKQPTTALTGRKRCLRSIYKCDKCKYRTKYEADLKKHTSSHYYEDKMYNCEFCEFVTNKTSRLTEHIKTTHLKQFDYKCHKCDWRTNHRCDLERHIKSKHLKEFHYKCDSCEYETNGKTDLNRHIKTKHLKKFDYKCDSCEFVTNKKNRLTEHIKTKHLKEFDYKCDCCEFETNRKYQIELHIKSKHLKQFDFKCESCEFGTNNKTELKKHIKSKHLKEFDYECDECEYRTNIKRDLEGHTKRKHL